MSLVAAMTACLVVGVSDGDTIRVRCGTEPVARVRLAEIDAPESHQAFGTKSKNTLSDYVFGQTVALQVTDTDRYQRLIAQVYVNGVHVNAAMVRDGFAWCYTPYVKGRWCAPLEQAAKADRRGLWADHKPVKPWEFRRK